MDVALPRLAVDRDGARVADDAGGGRVVVHLTINRAEHDADFVASMEQFVADFRAGLERQVPEILRAQREQAAAEKPEGMPWFG